MRVCVCAGKLRASNPTNKSRESLLASVVSCREPSCRQSARDDARDGDVGDYTKDDNTNQVLLNCQTRLNQRRVGAKRTKRSDEVGQSVDDGGSQQLIHWAQFIIHTSLLSIALRKKEEQ